jgi:hypothetical protein
LDVERSAFSVFASSSKAQENVATPFLDTLWSGLEHLYQEVKRVEGERAHRLGVGKERAQDFSYCTFGSEEGDSMICNYFLWYANSLYNFIQVFTKAFSPSEDLRHEFRAVIQWRHKVAAHTSWAWPKHDNAATQNMSILLFPEVSAGHFEVGGFQITSSTGESSCSEWRWGVVCTHEKLVSIVRKYL